ncbi:ABC transporter substrate-binding protein [Paludibacter jiangxiensis]|uniref:Iron complex transport system substrate-binding protein n=1 Tax=Paludibacter jiangxiensis TaxID=681398 RepID=A0A161LGF1_9BACT|nr:helical backbone metal receptor [Paludibacter jiangxiensis]GAT63977.1 iron complex transport system substrate-binding protein [Paludibacter jiangxiensis]
MLKRLLLLGFVLSFGCAMLLAAPAKRIISLSPSLTKNLQYLGDEQELVGCTSYCKTTRKVNVVATAVKVNVEKVVSLKPDLVVASSMTPPETVAQLKKFGIQVVMFPMPKSYAEICAQFRQLSRLVGREAVADKVLQSVQQRIDRVKARKADGRKIFIQLGVDPLFAVIPNTFLNDYISLAGGRNIAEGMTSGSITREAVLLKNPSVIFIVTMGNIDREEKQRWEKFSNLEAVRKKKVIVIDSNMACVPTPVTFAETLEVMMKALR